MANKQLIDYIKRQKAQGYGVNSIKLNLARSGYTPEQIEDAVGTALGRPKKLAKMILLVGGGAVVLAVLITSLIMIFSGTSEVDVPAQTTSEKDVGLDVFLDEETVNLGDNLVFEVRLTNLGSGSNFPVAVTSQVFDSDGEEIAKGEDVVTLGVQERKSYEMEVGNIEGDYQLEVTIEFSGRERQKTKEFQISESQVEIEGPAVLTGTAVSQIEDIQIVAEADYLQAKNLCLELDEELERDVCLLKVGLKTNKPEFCNEVINQDKRDSCYINIALSTSNFGLCEGIVDGELRETCAALGG